MSDATDGTLPPVHLPPVRRVLTGDDADGRSSIIEDGPTPAVRTVPERPGYRVSNIWRTGAAPAPVGAADSISEHKGIAPPAGGTVLRIIDFPPEPKDPQELKRMLAATFGNMYRDAQHAPRNNEHPGMHRTDTVDYALVLEGEMVAIMDKDKTLLRAGDVLIQRGTNHAWANRSGKAARIAFVLVDGSR